MKTSASRMARLMAEGTPWMRRSTSVTTPRTRWTVVRRWILPPRRREPTIRARSRLVQLYPVILSQTSWPSHTSTNSFHLLHTASSSRQSYVRSVVSFSQYLQCNQPALNRIIWRRCPAHHDFRLITGILAASLPAQHIKSRCAMNPHIALEYMKSRSSRIRSPR